MPELADIYALTRDRSSRTVQSFLDHFVPQREPGAEDYPIPQYADRQEFWMNNPQEVIDYCCEHSTEPYGLYWRNRSDSEPAHAMAFFTTDGHLILGVSAAPERAVEFRGRLSAFVNSDATRILHESPPPDNAKEFLELKEPDLAQWLELLEYPR
jgi:hypothetical protein